jgi:succinate dehydrogenase / fumarate reductase cytochrome b subunit
MGATSSRPFFFTTVGKKYLMGISGLIWAGFVFGHMAGNLLLFVSPAAYNAYGHGITSGAIIYFVEAILILALVTHVTCAINLTIENRRARGGQNYAVKSKTDKASTLASRTMGAQGSLVLAFIILHISTFKYGTYYETTVNGIVMRDLHRLVVEVFQKPEFVVWYLVALAVLAFHLRHGIASSFQSLGWKNDKTAPTLKRISLAYAIVVAGGFISQPVYMFFFAGK